MKTQCSVITLPEIGGLIKNLLDYLGGKRAQFWLKALKRFLRKENPWIPFQKVIEVPPRMQTSTSIEDQLEKLRKAGIDVFQDLPRIEKEARLSGDCILLEAPLNLGIDLPQHSVVAVRAEDLLSVEERLKLNYQQILEKAKEEYGLDWCSLAQGLDAWEVLVEENKNEDEQDRNLVCFICTKPFRLSGDIPEDIFRIPMMSASVGKMTKSGKDDERGYACMYSLNGDYLRNPKAVLLFRSIPY